MWKFLAIIAGSLVIGALSWPFLFPYYASYLHKDALLGRVTA